MDSRTIVHRVVVPRQLTVAESIDPANLGSIERRRTEMIPESDCEHSSGKPAVTRKNPSILRAVAEFVLSVKGLIAAIIFFLGAVIGIGGDFAGARSLLIESGIAYEIWPATNKEVLVLITGFQGSGSYDPAARLTSKLRESVESASLDSVRVEQITAAPSTQLEAIELGRRYGAGFVIWGVFDDAAIEPHLEVLSAPKLQNSFPGLGQFVNTSPDTYHTYIAIEMPKHFEFFVYTTIGHIYQVRNEPRLAIDAFSHALSIDFDGHDESMPLDVPYALRSLSYLELGEIDAAMSDTKMSIAANPERFDTYANLAVIQCMVDDYISARASIELAFKMKPDYWHAFDTSGLIYYFTGDHTNAILEFDEALQVLPSGMILTEEAVRSEKAAIIGHRALAYNAMGLRSEARRDYLRAIELDPEGSVYYHNLGNLELEDGNPKVALDYLQRALALGHKDHKTIQLRGVANRNLGNYDEALKDFELVIRLEPDYGGGYYERGVLRRLQGQYAEARRDFDRTIDIWPDNVLAYEERSSVALSMEDIDAALSDLDTLVEIDPDNPGHLIARGWVLLDYKKAYDDALADFTAAIALYPVDAGAYLGRGYVALERPDAQPDIALRECKQALKLSPDNAIASACAGFASGMLNMPEEAIRYFTASIERQPDEWGVLMGRSDAYAQIGNYGAALADCREVMRIMKQSGTPEFQCAIHNSISGETYIPYVPSLVPATAP